MFSTGHVGIEPEECVAAGARGGAGYDEIPVATAAVVGGRESRRAERLGFIAAERSCQQVAGLRRSGRRIAEGRVVASDTAAHELECEVAATAVRNRRVRIYAEGLPFTRRHVVEDGAVVASLGARDGVGERRVVAGEAARHVLEDEHAVRPVS